MFIQKLNNIFIRSAVATAVALAAGGCSWINDELPPCPAGLNLRFVFDYTMDGGDAFAKQVTSVNVWAFDQAGKCVWSGSEAGEALAQPGYIMETPLAEGTYDFVAWCGLNDNEGFNLQSYTPASKEDLEVRLEMETRGDINASDRRLKNLFNGKISGIEYKVDPNKPSIQTVTIPLVRDNNEITVMLQNINGFPIDKDAFTITVTTADSYLQWNNDPVADCPTATYSQWGEIYGEASIEQPSRTTVLTNTLMAGISTSRLIAGAPATLTIHRNRDNVDLIHIPIVEYFLMERELNHPSMDEQEYLDRRFEYSALFFFDNNYNLYLPYGIYINGWAVVPPQENPL